jgi:hypothetical protein
MSRKNRNASYGPRIVPLQKIAERTGVPIKPIIHLPEPDDETEPAGGNGIHTKRGVWEDMNIGKLRASWTPRESV